jgi:hypothetical protein
MAIRSEWQRRVVVESACIAIAARRLRVSVSRMCCCCFVVFVRQNKVKWCWFFVVVQWATMADDITNNSNNNAKLRALINDPNANSGRASTVSVRTYLDRNEFILIVVQTLANGLSRNGNIAMLHAYRRSFQSKRSLFVSTKCPQQLPSSMCFY